MNSFCTENLPRIGKKQRIEPAAGRLRFRQRTTGHRSLFVVVAVCFVLASGTARAQNGDDRSDGGDLTEAIESDLSAVSAVQLYDSAGILFPPAPQVPEGGFNVELAEAIDLFVVELENRRFPVDSVLTMISAGDARLL